MPKTAYANGTASGQETKLTAQIRGILKQYVPGSIFQELLQNAEDAGATEIHFLLDERRHENKDVPEFGEPALFVFNNSQFRDQDWKSLRSIADSKKRKQKKTIGKFGLGFNSSYHLTDLPTIISGNRLQIFDPSHLLGSKDGYKWVTKKTRDANSDNEQSDDDDDDGKTFPPQQTPYFQGLPSNLLGGEASYNDRYLQGTLFRFPLRTQRGAQKSKLLKEHKDEVGRAWWDIEHMNQLIEKFEEIIPSILLFLTSIRELSFSRLTTNGNVKEIFSIQATTGAEHRAPRQPHPEPFFLDLQFKTKRKVTMEQEGQEEIHFKWAVFNSVDPQHEDRLGGVAALISMSKPDPGEDDLPLLTSYDRFKTRGIICCYLPLPSWQDSGLPVVINGSFELESSRRALDRSQPRNEEIKTELIGGSYSGLMQFLMENDMTNRASRYTLFPDENTKEEWISLRSAFFRKLESLPDDRYQRLHPLGSLLLVPDEEKETYQSLLDGIEREFNQLLCTVPSFVIDYLTEQDSTSDTQVFSPHQVMELATQHLSNASTPLKVEIMSYLATLSELDQYKELLSCFSSDEVWQLLFHPECSTIIESLKTGQLLELLLTSSNVLDKGQIARDVCNSALLRLLHFEPQSLADEITFDHRQRFKNTDWIWIRVGEDFKLRDIAHSAIFFNPDLNVSKLHYPFHVYSYVPDPSLEVDSNVFQCFDHRDIPLKLARLLQLIGVDSYDSSAAEASIDRSEACERLLSTIWSDGQSGGKLSHSQLEQSCIAIQHLSTRRQKESLHSIPTPSETSEMRLWKDLFYDDNKGLRLALAPDSNNKIIHSRLNDLAKNVGMRSYTSDNLPNCQKIGPKLDFLSFIRDVLALEYFESSILSELMQNADDAGATKMVFINDRRTRRVEERPETGLTSTEMNHFLGPALYVYNDKKFNSGGSQDDFRNLCKVTDSYKRTTNSIGKFGVGFNSVYHLTDLPQVLSGKQVMFIDPHEKFLTGKGTPGLLLEYSGSKVVEALSRQLEPFNVEIPGVFSCNIHNETFDGTLFRFPLRHSDYSSSLKSGVVTSQDIEKLFEQFRKQAKESILFLPNITQVSLYDWSEDSPAPQLIFRVSKSSKETDILDLSRINFEVITPRGNVEKSSALKSREKVDDVFENRPGLAEVAVFDDASLSNSGRVFCFLPLPITSGLPFYVNGPFSLDKNRRHLSSIKESEWNSKIVRDFVPKAIFKLICFFCSREEATFGPDNIFKLWPNGDAIEKDWLPTWESFYKLILSEHRDKNLFPHNNDFYSLESIAIVPRDYDTKLRLLMEKVIEAVSPQKLVSLEPFIYNSLCSIARDTKTEIQTVDQSWVSSLLIQQTSTAKLPSLTAEETKCLFHWVIQPNSYNPKQLCRMPIFPVGNSTRLVQPSATVERTGLKLFLLNSQADIDFLADMKGPEDITHLIVSLSFVCTLSTNVKNSLIATQLFTDKLDSSAMIDLFQKGFHPSYLEDSSRGRTIAWNNDWKGPLRKLWSSFDGSSQDLLDKLRSYPFPIVPHGSHLSPVSLVSGKIVRDNQFIRKNDLDSTLQSLGIVLLNDIAPIPFYVVPATTSIVSLLKMIDGERVTQLSDIEKTKLRKALLAESQLEKEAVPLIKSLPIFLNLANNLISISNSCKIISTADAEWLTKAPEKMKQDLLVAKESHPVAYYALGASSLSRFDFFEIALTFPIPEAVKQRKLLSELFLQQAGSLDNIKPLSQLASKLPCIPTIKGNLAMASELYLPKVELKAVLGDDDRFPDDAFGKNPLAECYLNFKTILQKEDLDMRMESVTKLLDREGVSAPQLESALKTIRPLVLYLRIHNSIFDEGKLRQLLLSVIHSTKEIRLSENLANSLEYCWNQMMVVLKHSPPREFSPEESWIWTTSKTFASPAKTSLRDKPLAPYLFQASSSHSEEELTDFLRQIGVKDRFRPEDFSEVLELIQKSCAPRESKLTPEELKIVCGCLKAIANMQPVQLPNLFPLEGGILVSRVNKEIYYNDLPRSPPGLAILHKQISLETAQKLEISTVTEKKLKTLNFQPGALQVLPDIVEGFSSLESFLKEVIERAEDASATKISILLDRRTHGKETLLTQGMKEAQGPAVYVFYNGELTPNDFDRLFELSSNARTNGWRNRFPEGFRTSYLITDVLSVVSGNGFQFIDPNREFFQEDSGGKGQDLAAAIREFPDQFSPYKMEGNVVRHEKRFDLSQPLQGTLFRLPVRTRPTKIRLPDSVLTLKQPEHYFKEIERLWYDRLRELLVFTKSLAQITLLSSSPHGSASPKVLSTISVKRKSLTPHIQQVDISGTSWIVARRSTGEVKHSVDKYGAVAWTENLKADQGVAFSLLPQHFPVYLPVHIHGPLLEQPGESFFTSTGNEASDFNRRLFQEAIYPAYVDLIKYQNSITPGGFLKFWPTKGPLKDVFYNLFKGHPSESILTSSTGRVFGLDQVVFLPDSKRTTQGKKEKLLNRILTLLSKELVVCSESIFEHFKDQEITPKLLLQELKRRAMDIQSSDLTPQEVIELHDYVLNDRSSTFNQEDLIGVPLVPLYSGKIGVFGKKYHVWSKEDCASLIRIRDRVSPGITILDSLISSVSVERLFYLGDLEEKLKLSFNSSELLISFFSVIRVPAMRTEDCQYIWSRWPVSGLSKDDVAFSLSTVIPIHTTEPLENGYTAVKRLHENVFISDPNPQPSAIQLLARWSIYFVKEGFSSNLRMFASVNNWDRLLNRLRAARNDVQRIQSQEEREIVRNLLLQLCPPSTPPDLQNVNFPVFSSRVNIQQPYWIAPGSLTLTDTFWNAHHDWIQPKDNDYKLYRLFGLSPPNEEEFWKMYYIPWFHTLDDDDIREQEALWAIPKISYQVAVANGWKCVMLLDSRTQEVSWVQPNEVLDPRVPLFKRVLERQPSIPEEWEDVLNDLVRLGMHTTLATTRNQFKNAALTLCLRCLSDLVCEGDIPDFVKQHTITEFFLAAAQEPNFDLPQSILDYGDFQCFPSQPLEEQLPTWPPFTSLFNLVPHSSFSLFYSQRPVLHSSLKELFDGILKPNVEIYKQNVIHHIKELSKNPRKLLENIEDLYQFLSSNTDLRTGELKNFAIFHLEERHEEARRKEISDVEWAKASKISFSVNSDMLGFRRPREYMEEEGFKRLLNSLGARKESELEKEEIERLLRGSGNHFKGLGNFSSESNNEFADIEFVDPERTWRIPCHKLILASTCQHLKKALSFHPPGIIVEWSKDVMAIFKTYLYTGALPSGDEAIKEARNLLDLCLRWKSYNYLVEVGYPAIENGCSVLHFPNNLHVNEWSDWMEVRLPEHPLRQLQVQILVSGYGRLQTEEGGGEEEGEGGEEEEEEEREEELEEQEEEQEEQEEQEGQEEGQEEEEQEEEQEEEEEEKMVILSFNPMSGPKSRRFRVKGTRGSEHIYLEFKAVSGPDRDLFALPLKTTVFILPASSSSSSSSSYSSSSSSQREGRVISNPEFDENMARLQRWCEKVIVENAVGDTLDEKLWDELLAVAVQAPLLREKLIEVIREHKELYLGELETWRQRYQKLWDEGLMDFLSL